MKGGAHIRKISFASDNHAGIHPDIVQSIVDANSGFAPAYGDDPITRAAVETFQRHLGRETDVYFVFNGTGANVLALKALVRSYHAVICAATSHIYTDECGAVEHFCGCQLLTVPSEDGKLTVSQIRHFLDQIGYSHRSQPKVVSISQCTELGTVYRPEEIEQIASFLHRHGMFLHMDGARICNAAAGLNVGLQDISGGAGVDVLSFGGTKNGLMVGDAVVFFNRELSENFKYVHKQGMQTGAKMRFIAAQFDRLLSGNLWLNNARSANEMAAMLAEKLHRYPSIRITQNVEANAIFAHMPGAYIRLLQEKYHFHVWNEAESVVRLVTSFQTRKEDIEQFAGDIDNYERSGCPC